jgi:opacity protein-like surface antigen
MTDADGFEDDADLSAGSVIVGALVPIDANWFVAAEGETTLFTNYDAPVYTGGEDVDRIWRLRARGGYDFGQWSIFGALGGVWIEGPLAGTFFEDSSSGLTYGGGVEYAFDERIDLRLEVIRDETDFEDGTYEWDNTSLRAGAVIKF